MENSTTHKIFLITSPWNVYLYHTQCYTEPYWYNINSYILKKMKKNIQHLCFRYVLSKHNTCNQININREWLYYIKKTLMNTKTLSLLKKITSDNGILSNILHYYFNGYTLYTQLKCKYETLKNMRKWNVKNISSYIFSKRWRLDVNYLFLIL